MVKYGDVDIQNTSGYGVQVCIDRRLRGHGIYNHFHDIALRNIRDCGVTDIFAEISEDNEKSRRAHKSLGWTHVAAANTTNGTFDFRGNDIELLSSLYPSITAEPVLWHLYRRSL